MYLLQLSEGAISDFNTSPESNMRDFLKRPKAFFFFFSIFLVLTFGGNSYMAACIYPPAQSFAPSSAKEFQTTMSFHLMKCVFYETSISSFHFSDFLVYGILCIHVTVAKCYRHNLLFLQPICTSDSSFDTFSFNV